MKTYTIEQIRIYLNSCDSYGDVFYNFSEEKVDAALKAFEDKTNYEEDTYYDGN